MMKNAAAVPKPKGNGINDASVCGFVFIPVFWLLSFSYVWLCTIAGAAINFAEVFILTWRRDLHKRISFYDLNIWIDSL